MFASIVFWYGLVHIGDTSSDNCWSIAGHVEHEGARPSTASCLCAFTPVSCSWHCSWRSWCPAYQRDFLLVPIDVIEMYAIPLAGLSHTYCPLYEQNATFIDDSWKLHNHFCWLAGAVVAACRANIYGQVCDEFDSGQPWVEPAACAHVQRQHMHWEREQPVCHFGMCARWRSVAIPMSLSQTSEWPLPIWHSVSFRVQYLDPCISFCVILYGTEWWCILVLE